MPYSKNTWSTGNDITAMKLNNIESGIENVTNLGEDLDETVRRLRLNQIDLSLEVETLKGATLNSVTANIFIESFINTTDVTLVHGTYDATGERVYLI